MNSTMPLIVGLLDPTHRSLDSSLPLHGIGGADGNVDLDEIAAKQNAGGGMFDSVANMANSILGAGN